MADIRDTYDYDDLIVDSDRREFIADSMTSDDKEKTIYYLEKLGVAEAETNRRIRQSLALGGALQTAQSRINDLTARLEIETQRLESATKAISEADATAARAISAEREAMARAEASDIARKAIDHDLVAANVQLRSMADKVFALLERLLGAERSNEKAVGVANAAVAELKRVEKGVAIAAGKPVVTSLLKAAEGEVVGFKLRAASAAAGSRSREELRRRTKGDDLQETKRLIEEATLAPNRDGNAARVVDATARNKAYDTLAIRFNTLLIKIIDGARAVKGHERARIISLISGEAAAIAIDGSTPLESRLAAASELSNWVEEVDNSANSAVGVADQIPIPATSATATTFALETHTRLGGIILLRANNEHGSTELARYGVNEALARAQRGGGAGVVSALVRIIARLLATLVRSADAAFRDAAAIADASTRGAVAIADAGERVDSISSLLTSLQARVVAEEEARRRLTHSVLRCALITGAPTSTLLASGLSLGDDSISALGVLAPQSGSLSLSHLSLSGIGLTDAGAIELGALLTATAPPTSTNAQVLPPRLSVATLDISRNALSRRGVASIANALGSWPSVIRVFVRVAYGGGARIEAWGAEAAIAISTSSLVSSVRDDDNNAVASASEREQLQNGGVLVCVIDCSLQETPLGGASIFTVPNGKSATDDAVSVFMSTDNTGGAIGSSRRKWIAGSPSAALRSFSAGGNGSGGGGGGGRSARRDLAGVATRFCEEEEKRKAAEEGKGVGKSLSRPGEVVAQPFLLQRPPSNKSLTTSMLTQTASLPRPTTSAIPMKVAMVGLRSGSARTQATPLVLPVLSSAIVGLSPSEFSGVICAPLPEKHDVVNGESPESLLFSEMASKVTSLSLRVMIPDRADQKSEVDSNFFTGARRALAAIDAAIINESILPNIE